jgi:hypothetical protein
MSDDVIYLKDNAGLRRLQRSEFAREVELQSILADHPQLLGGAQMAGEIRFLLVKREAKVHDSDGSTRRWSVDHLMVDQHARPTIIEVKRSSDTRLRREVVGQLIEYAANGTAYWKPGELKVMAEQTHGEALVPALEALIGGPVPEEFWDQVDTNLAEGRVRLLLVADIIPSETRRMIEFLNDHMPLLEVAAVEVAHYASESAAAFVPRVLGQTERAKQAKTTSGGPRTQASEEAFLATLPEGVATWVRTLLEVAGNYHLQPYWGTKGVSLGVQTSGGRRSAVYVYPPGTFGNDAGTIYVFLGQYPEGKQEEVAAYLRNLGLERTGKKTLLRSLVDTPQFPALEFLDGLVRFLSPD